MSERAGEILCVVEDDRERERISSLLPSYAITGCQTIAQGLVLARCQRFDLYLLDLDLPDGTGFSLCQKIREFDPTTPIVVTALHDSESFRNYAARVGAQTFWGKHEGSDQLKLMIENSLRRSRVRLFEAKQAEFAAVRGELARQRDEARAERARASVIRTQCREKRAMLAAYRAFAAAGGSRAEFDRLWPDISAETRQLD